MDLEIKSIKANYEYMGENAILLCPPHPLMGGSRFDERLERIVEKLSEEKISSLRFDYRSYRKGIGEIEDAKICLDFLKSRHTQIGVVGYSFGSVVASNIAELCDFAIYISPLPSIDSITFRDSKNPKFFVIAKRDQFVSISDSLELISKASEPRDFVILDTDHFYFGKFDVLAEKICAFAVNSFLRLRNKF
ncbi:MAG: alpha/beta hydrolase [Archaeoglobaceae archaeon]|nr:alpha/beta hydrolase [Archaeoglobaceae archaeon]MDW8127725.1 alpha/beta hydrolase [Archaeoglobaceae archaeon]